MIKPIAKITNVLSAIDKREKGAFSAEWQILEKNIWVDESIMDLIPITSIHSALIDGEDTEIDFCLKNDYTLSDVITNNRRKLEDAFRVAEACGIYQKRMITVVVHLRNEILPISCEEIAQFLEMMFEKYVHCQIAIENVMVMNSKHEFRTAFRHSSVPEVVKGIREEIRDEFKDRVWTVLDVCHALSSIRIEGLICEYENLFFKKDEKEMLKKYFIENKDICKIIHFNNARKLGINQRNHGVPFETIEDIELMKYLLELYYKYIPEADFVIEIMETDYTNAVNFQNTVKQLQSIEKERKDEASK